MHNSLTVEVRSGDVRVHHDAGQFNWTVHLLETGLHTLTGSRVKQALPLVGDETFMMTYGDGVSNVDLGALVEFHRAHGKLATMTVVRPPSRFGRMGFDGDQVVEFVEKPPSSTTGSTAASSSSSRGSAIISTGRTMWERAALERLAGMVSSWPIAIRASGTAWTPCATNGFSESLWEDEAHPGTWCSSGRRRDGISVPLLRAAATSLGRRPREQPLANAFLTEEQLDDPEPRYPLHAYVCEAAGSSNSPSLRLLNSSSRSTRTSRRSRTRGSSMPGRYAHAMVDGLRLGPESLVIEVASNDGYLLRNFVERNIPVLGIDPARNVAEHARSIGVPTHVGFLGRRTAASSLARRRWRSRHRQQRPGARAGPERLHRRPRAPSRGARNADSGVPARSSPARGAPIRHDLPRALLVSLAHRGESGVLSTRTRASRGRGAADARRIAPRPRGACLSGAIGARIGLRAPRA